MLEGHGSFPLANTGAPVAFRTSMSVSFFFFSGSALAAGAGLAAGAVFGAGAAAFAAGAGAAGAGALTSSSLDPHATVSRARMPVIRIKRANVRGDTVIFLTVFIIRSPPSKFHFEMTEIF